MLAVALNTNLRFRNVYRLVFFLPVLTMPVAIGVVWNWIYNPDFGLFNQLLGLFDGPRIKWLTDPHFAMPALVILSVWQGSGYGMIIFLAGLQNIPREYYEAAQIDGATGWHRFLHVTLPLLSPTMFFVTVTSLISAFQIFDIVYAMTGGAGVGHTPHRRLHDLRGGLQVFPDGARYRDCLDFVHRYFGRYRRAAAVAAALGSL